MSDSKKRVLDDLLKYKELLNLKSSSYIIIVVKT